MGQYWEASLLFFTGLIALTASSYIWRRRFGPEIGPFVLCLFSVSVWAGGTAITGPMRWVPYVAAAGKLSLPVFWFIFSVRFLDTKSWYRSLSLPVIIISPVLIFGLHTSFPFLVFVYEYLLLFFGLLIFGHTAYRRGKVPFLSLILLLSAGLLTAGLHVLSLLPQMRNHLDFTPAGFLIFAAFVARELYRLNRLIVDSSVRHLYFESTHDGIVVFNKNGRIIDINPATFKLGPEGDTLLGKNFREYFGLSSFDEKEPTERFEIRKNDGFYDVGISPLKEGKRKGGLAVFRDITERKKRENELLQYATIDTLTSTYNRRMGLTILDQQLRFAERNGTKLTLCYVDINDLKLVNDNFGHAEGDILIKTVADIIKVTLRDSDVLCRLGGDEFLIILPDCALPKALGVWDRIEEMLREEQTKGNKPYAVTVARGFAEFSPGSGCTEDELLAVADTDMYQNKVQIKSPNNNFSS